MRLAPRISGVIFLATLPVWGQPTRPEAERYLPFGFYPHIDAVRGVRDEQSIQGELKNLTRQVGQTVKEVASNRSATCLGQPCLVQVFPLVYNIIDSGFFGGARAKLTNVSRQNPHLYSLDAFLVRSDTQQWLAYLGADFPDISILPWRPRIKANFNYSRTTETRYYGSGSTFDESIVRPDKEHRYASRENGFQGALIVPVARLENQRINFFTTFASVLHKPSSFINNDESKLFDDSPLGITGGVSTRLGIGVLIDSRDREVLSKTGWAIELSAETAGPPLGDFSFYRLSASDRRYFTSNHGAGSWTVANRLTVDSLFGDVPFWELTGVGGIDAIPDVASSMILRGFYPGRFHEKTKVINSSELRHSMKPFRIFGQHCQPTWIPIGADIARLGNFSAWGLTSGFKFYFNGTLLVQTYLSRSFEETTYNLSFGQMF